MNLGNRINPSNDTFKVGFIIIGAMKSGTTSLAKILKNHPEVGFSDKKELDFFNNHKNWQENIDKYHSEFAVKKSAKIYGEASPNYASHPKYSFDIAKNIASYNPEMKLIYIVRNPFKRIVSHYVHLLQRGMENDSIEAVVKNNPLLINFSNYFLQLKRFLKYFPKEQILIIDFKDFNTNRKNTVDKTAQFLDIDPDKFINLNVHANNSLEEQKLPAGMDKYFEATKPLVKKIPKTYRLKAKKILAEIMGNAVYEKPEMSDELKKWVWNQLREDMNEFFKLTGKERQHWIPEFSSKKGL